jgi:hypothetical protein
VVRIELVVKGGVNQDTFKNADLIGKLKTFDYILSKLN